jgi:hypothetical protein
MVKRDVVVSTFQPHCNFTISGDRRKDFIELTKIANDFFVMISKTKMLRSVQSFHQLKDGVSVAEANITEQEDCVFGRHSSVPSLNHFPVHRVNVWERTIGVLDDLFVGEVCIAGEEHIVPTINHVRQFL